MFRSHLAQGKLSSVLLGSPVELSRMTVTIIPQWIFFASIVCTHGHFRETSDAIAVRSKSPPTKVKASVSDSGQIVLGHVDEKNTLIFSTMPPRN